MNKSSMKDRKWEQAEDMTDKWGTDSLEGGVEYTLDNENFLKQIEARGEFEIVKSNDYLILLDLDSEEAYQRYKTMFKKLSEYFRLEENGVEEYFSVSGPPKRHVVIITEDRLTKYQRIALQAILGSDPMREFYSLMRVKESIQNPIFLLKPKGGKSGKK
jgi:DNA-binding Lrp family transcriptional regulator